MRPSPGLRRYPTGPVVTRPPAYVVYQSDNGYGFGDPIVLGNVLTTTVSGIAVGETKYFRIAATNDGGESMPTEVLAVRRPSEGTANVVIVNGFDRLRRQINPIQNFTQPPAYAGDWLERQIWRRSNSYDYVVQHAEALAAAGYGFASCSNEAVTSAYVQLGSYDIAVWICGTESTEDATFNTNEQSKITNFLDDGGAIFVSGSEVGYDLISQGGGASFAQDTLQFNYVSDDAGTYDVTPSAGGILSDVDDFDFDPAFGAPYDVEYADIVAPGTDAEGMPPIRRRNRRSGRHAVHRGRLQHRRLRLPVRSDLVGDRPCGCDAARHRLPRHRNRAAVFSTLIAMTTSTSTTSTCSSSASRAPTTRITRGIFASIWTATTTSTPT